MHYTLIEHLKIQVKIIDNEIEEFQHKLDEATIALSCNKRNILRHEILKQEILLELEDKENE